MNPQTQPDGRLKSASARELIQSANRLEVSYAAFLYEGFSLADLAHVITMTEAGIIPYKAAQELLSALLTVHGIPFEEFSFSPELGDAYKNREHQVLKLAPEAGGWLRTGRARREASNIAYQIAIRQRLLALMKALGGYAESLISAAEQHTATLMPDFTYMQQAQPTTFAHYLLSFAYPVLRDLERIKACFARANECPGGIGSINGSRLNFPRERIAELLGFDRPITHTRDAMWQADMPVEIMSCVVASILNIDRLGEDLQVWATEEFNLVKLADEYCRESVIMPQKKNPYSLAFVRGVAGTLTGQMVSMANIGRTMSGQPDNRIFAYGDIPKALELAEQTVQLMSGVVKTMTLNTHLMAERATGGYSQATDLAEVIMLEANLPYLTAHKLTGVVIDDATQQKIPAIKITSAMIDVAANKVLGRTLNLDSKILRHALQPSEIVATRTCLGGAAVSSTRAMITDLRNALEENQSWLMQTELRLQTSIKNLVRLAQAMNTDDALEPSHLFHH